MARKASPYVPSTAELAAVALSGSASDLGTGTLPIARIANGDVTLAKLADLAGLSIIGRSANSTGVPAAITGVDGQAIRVSGTALGFGTIVAAGIASDAVTTAKILDANVTLAKLANLANATVIGRNTSGTGVPEAVTMAQLQTLLATAGGWVTDTVAGSAVQDLATSLSMSGTDQDYEIEATILTPAATRTYTAQPNALATNQTATYAGRDDTATYSAAATDLYIVDVVAAQTAQVYIRINQRTGQTRQIVMSVTYTDGSGGHTVWGQWNVTTEITSFRIHGSAASSISIGSTIRARRV